MKNVPSKLVEDHDETYYFWKKLGLSERPLIHLDAHIDFDFYPVKSAKEALREAKSKKDLIRQLSAGLLYEKMNIREKTLTNIGNYIYPAMRSGIVGIFYWVIPGDRREFNKSLKKLRNTLKPFFSQDPFETKKIEEKKGMLKAKVCNRDFIITTLEDLPENIKGGILDIDTDYLTTDTILKANPCQEAGKRFPWIWPEELVSRLKKKKIKPSCITIAYSVNGGFTPLIYKFLGDEIAIFLKGTNTGLRDIITTKNKAFTFFKQKKIKKATNMLKGALKDADTVKTNANFKNKLKTHLFFALFRCYAELNNVAKAKHYYNLAIALDKTYRAKDNNYGYLYLEGKRGVKKAEREFKTILSVDRNNSYALSGLALIFAKRKKLKRAKILFKKAYAVNSKNQEALINLARAELGLKNYKAVLKCAKGRKLPYRMGEVLHSLLARAYEGLGRTGEALDEYRLVFRFGVNLIFYLRLLKLLRKIGIPAEHKGWIESRIKVYKDYRDNFFKAKKKPAGKIDTKRGVKREKLLNRIDGILKKLPKYYYESSLGEIR